MAVPGIVCAALFGFTLTWNDYDRSTLFQAAFTDTLPLAIGSFTFTGSILPDLYALGTATTLFTILVILIVLLIAFLRLRITARGRVTKVEEELGIAEGLEAARVEGR